MPFSDKEIHNYDIEWSNHPPSLSTLRQKGFSCSMIKWWAIYTNLPVIVIVRPPQPQSRDIQGQKTFLETSGDKQIRNYDTEWSKKPPSLSALSSNWLSRSMIKYWAICTNLPVNVIFRLTHPLGGNSQDQERFLEFPVYEQTLNYNIEC